MILIIISCTALLGAAVLLWIASQRLKNASRATREAVDIKNDNKREIENERREALIKLKDELYKRRSDAEAEIKKERGDLERFQHKLASRLETLEKNFFTLNRSI